MTNKDQHHKKKKIIKIYVISCWNEFVEFLEQATEKKPKYFKFLFVGSTDYVIAYSTQKFTKTEALKIYEKHYE